MSYRFAIIGSGSIAPRHAAQIIRVGQLAAVCDSIISRADTLAGQYAAGSYREMADLLNREQPDIVVICTPNGLHADQAIRAMQSGCHVLCEKPMAITVADSRKMIAAASQNNRRLFVVKQNRFNPPVVAVRKLLDEGKLGRIHAFQVNCFWNRPSSYYLDSWRGSLKLDGGTLYTQFSHFIDLLQWYLGEVKEVQGYRSNAMHQGIIEFEDHGVANLLMRNGAIGTLQYSINAFQENMEGSITLFGEMGTVKIGGQYLNRLDHFQVDGIDRPVFEDDGVPNRYEGYKGSMSNHHRVYDELISALAGSGNAVPEGKEGMKSIEIIDKIYAGSPLLPFDNITT